MSKQDDGGNAFPRAIHDQYDSVNGYVRPQEGMSLRDYFAGQVLPECVQEFWGCEDGNTADHAASAAYSIADAMLKARQE
jgi:hypothetical protein